MAKRKLKDIARETMEAVVEVTGQVEESANKAVEIVTSVVKETVEKDPAVAEAVKEAKETVEKAAGETKKAAKRTVKKATAAAQKVKEPVVKETYIQYFGKEISHSAIVEKVTEDYIAEGHKKSDILEIELYIKPEDDAVYYVINGTDTGKVAL